MNRHDDRDPAESHSPHGVVKAIDHASDLIKLTGRGGRRHFSQVGAETEVPALIPDDQCIKILFCLSDGV